jgi:hypothetical protein
VITYAEITDPSISIIVGIITDMIARVIGCNFVCFKSHLTIVLKRPVSSISLKYGNENNIIIVSESVKSKPLEMYFAISFKDEPIKIAPIIGITPKAINVLTFFFNKRYVIIIIIAKPIKAVYVIFLSSYIVINLTKRFKIVFKNYPPLLETSLLNII